MIDLLSAYKCFCSNVIASSIFVFEYVYQDFLNLGPGDEMVGMAIWCHLINYYIY